MNCKQNLTRCGLHLFILSFALAMVAGRHAAAAPPAAPAVDVKARAAVPAAESLTDYVKRTGGRFAYGLYVGKQKVGWTVDEMRLGQFQGKPAAIASSEGRMEMLVLGEASKLEWQQRTYYGLSGEGTVLKIEETSNEDGRVTQVTAERKGDKLNVRTVTAGVTTERQAGIPKDTLQLMQRYDRWLSSVQRAGDEFRAFSTDLDADDIDRLEVHQFQKRRPFRWKGVATELIDVKVTCDGAVCVMEAFPNGSALKGKLGPFDMRLEEEAVARNVKAALIDLDFVVPVDALLGDPRNVDQLKLKLSELGDFQIPQNATQQVLKSDGGTAVVEIKRSAKRAKPEPLDEAARKLHLKSTPMIQADDPKIRKLAAEIVGEHHEPRDKAERINRWVHENLKQTYQANATSALEVLANKAGDCSEHTLLFVALCRAVGVPTREVGGLAYDESSVVGGAKNKRGKGTFGWHAWAEIHDGQRWSSMDPTWDETEVDATHLVLSVGSDDFAWVNVLGQVKIKVLEFTSR